MSVLVLAVMVAIGYLLWTQSSGARTQFGLSFFLPSQTTSWDPVNGQFKSWPFIYGTLITSLVAIALALPTSLGIAIFLAELCPAWLRLPLGMLVELLAAIPSVVYGLWGIFVFLPGVVTPIGTFLEKTLGVIPVLSIFFTGPIPPSGASRLAAGLILAIMIIPTIAASPGMFSWPSPLAARSLPGPGRHPMGDDLAGPDPLRSLRHPGSGHPGPGPGPRRDHGRHHGHWQQHREQRLPLAPGYTMSSIIANEFAEAVNQLHSEALIEVAFILFIMTLLLNVVARFLVWRVARRTPAEARA